MNFISIIGLGLLGLIAYVAVTFYRNYKICPNIKGPFIASISGWWLFRTTAASRMYLDLIAVIKQYDTDLVRISPNKVVTNDPELWRKMSAPRSPFTRGTWYDSMSLDPRGNILSCRDEKSHNLLRSKMIRAYSGKDVPNLERNIDSRITDLMTLIKQESSQDKLIDFANVAQFFTLDVLTEMAFEAPFGFLTKNKDIFQYIKQVSDFLSILELCCNFPFMQSLITSRLMSGFSPKPTDKTGLGAMLGVAQEVVQRRYAPDAKEYDDMLGSFKKNGLTVQEAESEAMLQILAGSDSTATAIRMTFLHILTSPRVYAKLTKEVRTTAAKRTSAIIKSSEARELPYLQACIKEGLRIFPPLAGLLTKVVPPGGETHNGVHIPAGVEICWSPFSMQHRKDIYGPDADVFKPERWLEARDETLNKMERTLELVFGSGKYGCLGKTVAWMELDKVFVALLQDYDWGLTDPVNPIRTRCHGVHVQTDMWVRAIPCQH